MKGVSHACQCLREPVVSHGYRRRDWSHALRRRRCVDEQVVAAERHRRRHPGRRRNQGEVGVVVGVGS